MTDRLAAESVKARYVPPLSDDEKRIAAWLRWKSTTLTNIEAQIALELAAENIEARKHHDDD